MKPSRPVLILIIGVTSAMVLVVSMAAALLHPPEKDLILLAVYLALTGLTTLAISYLAYRFRVISWFRSLQWALLGAVALTVLLIFLNTWVTARLMFTSEHDLGLTSLLLLFAGICALSFGYFISQVLTERIDKLADGAERLSTGNLAERVALPGNDELAGLAATFNLMAQRLEEADRQKRMLEQTRRDLVAWVSHDLRTPLTSIRVMIEAMADGVVDDRETMQRYIATAQREIKHLSDLINDLFDLSQMDAEHSTLRMESSSLGDLISDTLEAMHARAEERGIVLSGQVAPGIDPICLAPEKIQRVLNNLIGNALRHTPAGGKVTVTATLAGNQVQVAVCDTGEGIQPADVPHVFDRFWRAEQSRRLDEHGERGAGLGLAIAKALVEAHDGTIRVESTPGQGTMFTFSLPRRV